MTIIAITYLVGFVLGFSVCAILNISKICDLKQKVFSLQMELATQLDKGETK